MRTWPTPPTSTRPASVSPPRSSATAPTADADGAGYLTAQERMWQANRALRSTGRFGKRPAARTAREATEAHTAMLHAVRRRWGGVPLTTTHLPFWTEAAARRRGDADPRVIEAQEGAERAHQQLRDLTARHMDERAALWRSIGGGQRPSTANARAAEWRRSADQARRLLAEIEALPIPEAAQLIQRNARHAAPESTAEATAQAHAVGADGRASRSPAHRLPPRRDLGLRL